MPGDAATMVGMDCPLTLSSSSNVMINSDRCCVHAGEVRIFGRLALNHASPVFTSQLCMLLQLFGSNHTKLGVVAADWRSVQSCAMGRILSLHRVRSAPPMFRKNKKGKLSGS